VTNDVRFARYLAIVNVVFLWFLMNAIQFNFIAKGTFFYGWKQFIALLMLGQVVIVTRKFGVRGKGIDSRLIWWVWLSVILVVALSAMTLFAGLSILRIAHAAVAYIGFCGFAFAPKLAGIGKWQRGFLKSISFLGVFCGVGLVVDYFYNVFDLLIQITGGVPEYQEWADRYVGTFYRSTFLFESPSNIFPILSLSIICLIFLGETARRLPVRILYRVAILPIIFGIFVTLTRAQWILTAILIAGFGVVTGKPGLRGAARRFGVICFLAITVLVMFRETVLRGTYGQEIIERMTIGMTLASSDHEERFWQWEDGLKLFAEPSLTWVTGHGLGTTMAQIDDGQPLASHFESSIFQCFYEGGVGGLVLRLWMPAAVFIVLKRSGTSSGSRGRLLKLWVVCYVLAIGVAPTANSYHAQAALALSLGLACMPKEWWTQVEDRVVARAGCRPKEQTCNG